MPISVWGHCNNIVGVTRVHWRIYSKGVVQYIIQRREAPRDILFNPEGVYSPMYPCHAHYIITIYLLHNYLETNLINPQKINKWLVLIAQIDEK